MAKTLYICYFGLHEPLVQTQVIPYLRELVKGGHEVSLLTFESKVAELRSIGVAELKREFADQGIKWHWLRYHKWPSAPATTWDILVGTLYVAKLLRREKFDVLHGRVHIPTLMGAMAKKLSSPKPMLLFDIRGFFPEEYTDAGIWPEGGWLYRAAKRVEKWLLKEADGFVVLTEKARNILFPESLETGLDNLGRPVEVIPCCVDLSRFESANEEARRAIRLELNLGERFVAAYVGAFGGWYLTEETADFFGELKKLKPDAFAMILTQSRPDMIEPLLRERGYGTEDYLIKQVPPDDVPRYLSGADLAVSIIKPCYSKQASSPTKNAEFLACGLPIIANAGVGDVDRLIIGNRVGALIREFKPADYAAAFDAVETLGDIGEHCREVARREFDLANLGGVRYRNIYARLLGQNRDV